ncbi:hypothetical protein E2C04_11545 [Nocardioides daphniae]|uniref:MASE1 domain-containing protein n=1 Tax=Nocardioides daphniae TaxID=402297 RepID=A0A4P7UE27_9ACTN|nr:hypothetical protein E2C04_11545 [Nocardioides daphniae]
MTPRFLHPGTPAWTLVVVALLVASGLGALHTAPHGSLVPTWWPPVGLGIALLAMTSRRWWYVLVPAVGGATLLTNVVHEAPLDFSLVFTVLSMVQAVAGALVLRGRRHHGDVQLTTQDDVVDLGVAALCAATISAVGAALAGLVGRRPGQRLPLPYALPRAPGLGPGHPPRAPPLPSPAAAPPRAGTAAPAGAAGPRHRGRLRPHAGAQPRRAAAAGSDVGRLPLRAPCRRVADPGRHGRHQPADLGGARPLHPG